MLKLYLPWDDGELVFYDPATGKRILTYEDQQARAGTAEAQRDAEQRARITEQTRADTAEARVRELEEQLRRL